VLSVEELIYGKKPIIPTSLNVWQGQQYLKLRLGDICQTEWLLVHDAKDFYKKKINYKDLFTKDNKVKQTVHTFDTEKLNKDILFARKPANSPFDYAWAVTAVIWNYHTHTQSNLSQKLQNDCTIDCHKTLTETPYWFHVPTLQEMNKECDEKLGGYYPLLFFCFIPDTPVPLFTEFFHYSNYVAQTKGGLDTLYEPCPYRYWNEYVTQSKKMI